MFGKLFGRGEEGPGADPHALPVPRRKNGVHPLRALGDRRVLAAVEAADAGDWEGVKEALAPFDLGRDHQVLGGGVGRHRGRLDGGTGVRVARQVDHQR